ncbi:dna repair protein [Liquorilactobacillus aquaticus DSM 21051]|uniref:DNA repair protein RecN n=1 Tax=Liquorilactobacillus aquaticus DSM 21051 TaxID=1423725 RepID=A0A0R2D813_9LACO|nr:DNA repair protein RecN [Liquorilactobacillus aquaticus]KRM96428.1 dna repair protein [Liquorilactobacillus aquaticus DSM 21051]
MLQELTIRDFAIIEKMDIEFQAGMTVLTGETGAGKSIVIDALGLLAGGRASQEFIRKGANKSMLQGLFTLSPNDKLNVLLNELGIELEDDGLILQRDLYRSGRSVCRVNGILVNLSVLKQIGEKLIDIHGQNEHQELMKTDRHIALLDEYIPSFVPLKEQYVHAFHKYNSLKAALKKKEANEKEWVQRLDMLKFQVKEIEDADLKMGEEEKLSAEKNQLENYQTIRSALLRSYQLLSGETTDTLGQIGGAMEELNNIASYSDKLRTISEGFADAFYALQDAAHEISGELDMMEWDEDRLNEIVQRLELIHQLEHKYGDSIQQIIKYQQKISKELSEMQKTEDNSEQQKEAVQTAFETASQLANKLSGKRHEAAKKLQKDVHRQLKELFMDKALFEVKFRRVKVELGREGIDEVEFYIQTNPGEAMGPLAKIASGGELSRIMLALKTIFAQTQGVTSIIFDEVDTGVSGRVAQAIAEKISQIASHSQVLCITHLPQVAAISDHHYFLAKHTTASGRTETSIKKMSTRERVNELARMLAGTTITKLTLEHAEELLEMSNALKVKRDKNTQKN